MTLMHWTCPSIWLCGLWGLWLGQALWGWHNTYKFRRLLRYQGRRSDGQVVRFTPPAAVIVPVKGLDLRFSDHLEALLAQDYPTYRVLLVVESRDDPAYPVIARRLERATGAPADRVLTKTTHTLLGVVEAGLLTTARC